MNREELININGGSFTATMINAISRGISTLYDLGRALGSAASRITKGSTCPLK